MSGMFESFNADEVEKQVCPLKGGYEAHFARDPITGKWHIQSFQKADTGKTLRPSEISPHSAESMGWERLEFKSPEEGAEFINRNVYRTT